MIKKLKMYLEVDFIIFLKLVLNIFFNKKFYNLIKLEKGNLYCIGKNDHFQCGFKGTADKFIEIDFFKKKNIKIKKIICGGWSDSFTIFLSG
jgi:alpha-tubulin suppressor-like RCC1 family protein